jgi:hypothetical protein
VSEMPQVLMNLLQAAACLAYACETEGRELNSDRLSTVLKMFNQVTKYTSLSPRFHRLSTPLPKILHFYTREVLWPLYKNKTVVPNLGQINSVYKLTLYQFNVHFNIIFLLCLCVPSRLHRLGHMTNEPRATCLVLLLLLDLITLIFFRKGYRS